MRERGRNFARPAAERLSPQATPLNTRSKNPPIQQILVDSEGIDAYNQTAQDGVQLLSMAVLLASTVVFNQMGPIDEAAIDRLGLVTEVGVQRGGRDDGSGGGWTAEQGRLMDEAASARILFFTI